MASERKRVLVVDDDQDCLTFACGELEEEGFEVITAHDGEEGLKKAQAERPDLVVLDVIMPGQDGWDTCDRLREAAETRRVPILFLTCVTGPKTLYMTHGAFETDWDEYLTKPVSGKALRGAVRRLLDSAAVPR